MHADESASAGRADVSLGSVALARLIAEVRTGEVRPALSAYNRTYNRHNR